MKKVFLVLAICLCLMASTAMATPFNTRPVIDPNTGSAPVSGSATSTLDPLQSVFTGLGSSINVYDDQLGAAIFLPTDTSGPGASIASYIASVTWNAYMGNYEIGLYKYGDPTKTVKLFDESTGIVAGSGDDVTVDFKADGSVVTYWSGGSIDNEADFGLTFGFYLDSVYGTWYSEDSLNGGLAQMLVYSELLGSAPYYYFAMEGAASTAASWTEGNIDFNDFVLRVESVQPVPEPATMLLLGSGLIGLAGIGRRKFFKK